MHQIVINIQLVKVPKISENAECLTLQRNICQQCPSIPRLRNHGKGYRKSWMYQMNIEMNVQARTQQGNCTYELTMVAGAHTKLVEAQDRPNPSIGERNWSHSPPSPSCGATGNHQLLGEGETGSSKNVASDTLTTLEENTISRNQLYAILERMNAGRDSHQDQAGQ